MDPAEGAGGQGEELGAIVHLYVMEKSAMQVNEAIVRAKEIVIELFGTEGIVDINLEEVALNRQRTEWYVVVSFVRPVSDKQVGSLGQALANIRARHKKQVRFNSKTGEFIAVTDSVLGLNTAAA
jgi:hypothetical protein